MKRAMIESARMLLEWLGHNRGIAEALAASSIMTKATIAALARPETRTGDIRGTANTEGMTSAIVAAIEKEAENVLT